jgi:ABC-type uncharacterized transport system substrate-binding protein
MCWNENCIFVVKILLRKEKSMKQMKFWTYLLIIGVVILLCTNVGFAQKKKVLFIDSYHEGYEWSDGIVRGVKNVLGDKCELKIVRMDTKRNPSDDFKKKAGEKVKQEIDAWKPDVVIAADDNASAYVIVPFYKDKDLPFVFCGLNWDASIYGFPCKNVTGMIEVSMGNQVIDAMKKFAKGNKKGFLSVENETSHKEYENWVSKLNLRFERDVHVKTFEEWKKAFIDLQGKVDMIVLENNAGIQGWNEEEAKKFVRAQTKIPTGCIHDFMAEYCLVGYTKIGEEQGEWAAGAALQILSGKSPKDIPVVMNQKGQLYANLAVAKKLNVTFPLTTLKAAKVIKE